MKNYKMILLAVMLTAAITLIGTSDNNDVTDRQTERYTEAVRIIITRQDEILSVDLPAKKIDGELYISDKSVEELLKLFSLTYQRRPDEEKPKIRMRIVDVQADEPQQKEKEIIIKEDD